MLIRELKSTDIYPEILMTFRHCKTWSKQWRKTENGWRIVDCSVVRQWNEKKRRWISQFLLELMAEGGSVFGAFYGNQLVGFSSVNGDLRGKNSRYAGLSMLFVDDEFQRQGIGKALMDAVIQRAGEMGAEKLYIPAVPSCDTIAFYMTVGCRDAEEYIPEFADAEDDRHLELLL